MQPTGCFVSVYIFVIVEVRSPRIVWFNATTSPSLPWVNAQIRQACPFAQRPGFFIHDNASVFGQFRKRERRRPFRSALDQWLGTVMGIRGIPIPYRAPNANAHCERLNRTLREQVLDHFTTSGSSTRAACCACSDDTPSTTTYNRARPSQAIRAIPDPYPELRDLPPPTGQVVALPVLGGLHHDYRRAA